MMVKVTPPAKQRNLTSSSKSQEANTLPTWWVGRMIFVQEYASDFYSTMLSLL